MNTSDFYIIFFDRESNFNNEDALISNAMNRLHRSTYTASSIIISAHGMLLKSTAPRQEVVGTIESIVQTEIEQYLEGGDIEPVSIFGPPNPEQQKKRRSYFDIPKIQYFVLPVALAHLDDYLNDFKNEIAFLKEKD
jgi:hypothetical protein